jgi:hypothetical protein
MTNRYARIDATNTVTQIVLLGDDVSNPNQYCQKMYKTNDQFLAVPGNSTKVGPSYSWVDPNFVERQPYSSWTSSTTNNITTWNCPVDIPTTVNNDQPAPSTISQQDALKVFYWDEPNTRWLNSQNQYWNEGTSAWVDI